MHASRRLPSVVSTMAGGPVLADKADAKERDLATQSPGPLVALSLSPDADWVAGVVGLGVGFEAGLGVGFEAGLGVGFEAGLRAGFEAGLRALAPELGSPEPGDASNKSFSIRTTTSFCSRSSTVGGFVPAKPRRDWVPVPLFL